MIRFEDFISKDTNGDTNGDYVHTAKSVCVCVCVFFWWVCMGSRFQNRIYRHTDCSAGMM